MGRSPIQSLTSLDRAYLFKVVRLQTFVERVILQFSERQRHTGCSFFSKWKLHFPDKSLFLAGKQTIYSYPCDFSCKNRSLTVTVWWPARGHQTNTPLRLTASLWTLFEVPSCEILEAKFGFSTKTFVYQCVFMQLAVVVLILWQCTVWKSIRDLTVKNESGCKVSPRKIFHGQSLYKLFYVTLS